ncbi:putative extracellular calcium-sensing receptor-like [Scomber scombrus]|uniref:Extracellular calcium-sensing receptor-like n=1 Tax=Scomber scombrus TaxID=13677 RepID=A0AAV1NVZ6_SCOSC
MEITALITVLSLAPGLFELLSCLALNNYGDGVNQKAGHTEPTTDAGVTEAPSVKCKLQGSSRLPAFSMDGDYIIGGVFSIHYYMHTVKHNYTSMPEPLRCTGSIDSRELRFSRAMVFAIQEINNSTELLPGIRLGYQIHDSCASVPVAVHVAFQLSNGQDPVFNITATDCSQSGVVMAIVGESGSTPSISMSHITGPFNIPQVSHFATCACLSNKQQYPSFFRTIPSDQFQADALAKLVKHFGWTWIGAVRSDSDYGNNGMASFLHAAYKEGICVEYSEYFYRTHPHSRIQRVADVIRRSTAMVVVAFVASGDMRILLEELSRQPFPPHQWIGSESWVTDPDMLRFSFCAGAIGFGIQKSVIPGLRDFLLDLSPTEVVTSPLLTEFWEDAFKCRLGKSVATDERVCDGSEDIQELRIAYTDTSQLRVTNMVYKAVYAIAHAIHNAVCQETNSTSHCDKFTRIESTQVLTQLKKVNFSQNGYHLSFDANGDPVAMYELVNWQKSKSGSFEVVTVGHYDGSLPVGQEFNINRNLTWVGDSTQVPVSVCSDSCRPGTRKVLQKGKPICCYDCIPCPEGEISNATDSPGCFRCPKEFWPNAERDTCFPKPVEFLSFDEVLGIILAAFSVGGASLAIMTAAVFFHNRASPIVRANNSELSFLLLFSLTLCFLCALTFIGAPSEWSCMLRHTAFGITFVLCISCILGKTIVVLMAFRATLPEERESISFEGGVVEEETMAERLTGVKIEGVSGDSSSLPHCVRLGDSEALALQSEGDVVIGGLFPLHYVAPEPHHSYNSKPLLTPCSGFDHRAFRWMMTMVFAVQEINQNSSLLPGVKLDYLIMDSCDHVHTSLRALFSLVSHSTAVTCTQSETLPSCLAGSPVPAVIGLASSSPTRAVAHTFGPFNIPLVSYFATCTCLTDKHVYPSFLRTVPNDLFQVRGLVQLVTFLGWRWVGTIGTTDDYSHYGIQAFSNQFKQQGGCLEFHLTISKSPTLAEIQEMADRLQRSTAQIVVVFATEGQLLELLSELAQRNVTGIQWVASEAWVTASLLTSPHFHPLLEGTLGFSFPGVWIPGLKEFLLNVHPSPEPGMEFVNMFWEELFGCRLQFSFDKNYKSAAKKPVCTGSEDLRFTDSSYTDISQVRISYNVYKAVYAIAHALHRLLSCDSKGMCEKKKSFSSRQLLHHLKTVNFTTQFEEKVYFDSSGEPVPLYDIINWQKDNNDEIRFIKVGSYDGSAPLGQQLQMNKNTIVWTKGQSQVPVSQCSAPCQPGSRQARRPGQPHCCFDCLPCADGEISNQTGSTECTKCPEYYWSDKDHIKCVAGVEEFLSFNDTMGIILVALTVLGVILTTIITTVFHHFRSTPIVKANNSEISFLLLLSLKLCFLCSLVFIGQPSVWTCRLRQAAFGISFVLCLSCLLVKTIVVLSAFRANAPGSWALKLFGPSQQRILIICTTAPQVCLCTGWLLGAPPFPFRNPTYQASTGKIVVECKEPWPPGFYLVLGYIGLLAFLCLLLAFLGRKLPDTFNEAKLITFSMLIFWAVWISFIPAYVSSPGKFTVARETSKKA